MLRLISWERISSTQQRRGGSGTVAIAIAAVGVLMALTPATAYAQVQTLSCGNFTDQLYSFPGLMFDVVAKVPIQITGLSHTLAHPAGSSVAYEVYTKPDSFLGFQDSEDDWVQIGAGTVTSQGPTARTVFPIGTTSLPLMNTGARRAFYVTATAGRSIYQGRTGGSIDDLPDTVAAQNAHLWISESVSKSFRFAGTSYPRIWSGTISYNLANCTIGGTTVVPHDTVNTANQCEVCDVIKDASNWSPRPPTTPCPQHDDGNACTSNVCNESGVCTHPVIWGCLIPGEGCVPEGAAKDGSEGCNVCVHSSPEVYTPQPGNPCTDDLLDCTTDQCNATGTCSHILKPDTCLIGGTECADAGDSDPDNECKACRPELSVDEYRDRDPGYVCVEGADDYHCTDDICDGFGACTHPVARGCLIDDDEGKACFELGDIDPLSEGCRVCSAANPNGWYPLDEGEPCDDDGLAWTVDTCDGAGTCRHIPTGQCYIEGEFFANGEVNPKNPCEECDSGTLVTNWLPRPQGTDCPTDNLGWTIDECDGFGACTHEPIDGCWIDGDRVPVGDVNPDNECQWCNPAASASNWSPRPKGTECESDGRTCTHDQCDGFGECEHPVFTGCLIGGLCIDDRASDPANDCMECNIAQANDRYSPKANGEVCEDDGVEIGACDGSGQCFELPPGKCIVDDEEFANGATNPEKPCQRCDAFMNPTGWTNRAKGAACTDDGLTCTSNSCDGFGTCDAFIITGCLIGGACVDVGAKNSSNKCEECDPAFSNTGYGPSAPGTQCQEGDLSTLNVCDGEGKCETTPKGACNIDGVWVDSGTINPAQDCQWCDPGEDSEDWSQRPAGSTCSSDGLSCTLNACSSVGNCDPVIYPAWCLIDGKCVGNHGAEIDDDGNVVDCMECNVAKSQDEYSKKPKGEICSSEDGDIKIIDTCDDGVCHHDPRIDCRIGGEDVLGGAINPANDCEWCSAGDNPGSWTLKAAGSACSSDGLPCTDDVCDADGECKHNLTGGCIIDNACVPVGPKSADEPCEICDPAKSTTQWVHSESKECNPCTEDSECPAGEECVSGECVPEPECKTGVDCPSGVCEDGVCVPKKPDCTDDDECPPNQVCVGGVCQNVTRTPECETDDQCPEGKECVNGDCKDIPSECRADSECPFGKCVDGECQSTLYVEGSGCGCRTLGAGVSSVGGVSGLLALLGLAWLRVRRGREDSC